MVAFMPLYRYHSYGTAILDDNDHKSIDRTKLGALIFADGRLLNRILPLSKLCSDAWFMESFERHLLF